MFCHLEVAIKCDESLIPPWRRKGPLRSYREALIAEKIVNNTYLRIRM